MRDLAKDGHNITVYTLSNRSPLRMLVWFLLLGIPVRRLINSKAHYQAFLKGRVPHREIKWPPTFGIDLLIDDSPINIVEAEGAGCAALLLTNQNEDWTAQIRRRCFELQAAREGNELSSVALA